MPRQLGGGSEPQSEDKSALDETKRIDTREIRGAESASHMWEEEIPSVDADTAAAAAPERKRRTGLWITLVVLAAAACIGGYFWVTSERAVAAYDDQTQIMDDGTFYEGVSVLGTDVSGLTVDEARPLIEEKVAADMNAMSVVYTVEDDTYELGAEDLGASIDVEALLDEAISYGRTGSFPDRQKAIQTAKSSGMDFANTYGYSEESVAAAVSEALAPLADSAQDAQVVINTTSDEGSKTTDYQLAFVDEVAGIGVNEEKLVADILVAAQAGAGDPVAAEVTVREPNVTREQLENQYAVRGVYSTEYGSSAEGRRYNIWKMSDIINGVEILPGETWSINEEAGPRTYDLGWKGAPGISDGAYQEEAGGGICQVSSTLYNAVLRAEVEVAERTHHSWPLSYVPGGLDATISTGAPDFKITNNLDVPIYIVTRCDGEGDRTVEVAIIGPKFEDGLTREFTSELISTTPAGSAVTVSDSSLPAGSTQTIIGAHEGKTFRIYKKYYDADGNQVGETEVYMTDTYAPKPAKIRVGTGASRPAPVVVEEPDPAPAPEQPAEQPAESEPAPAEDPAGAEG